MSQRILIVDDSATVRKLVERVLSRCGYLVDCASSGQQGLDAASVSTPDLILVDFVMPGMYGHVFCRKVRKLTALTDVPIVLISAKSESIGYYFEEVVGVVHTLTKPFESTELIEVVERFLPDAKTEDTTTEESKTPTEPMELSDTTAEFDEDVLAATITDRVDRVVQKYFQAGFPQLMRQVMWSTLRESGLIEHENLVLSSSLQFLGLSDTLSFVHQAELSGKVTVVSERLLGEIYLEKGQFVFAKVSQKGEHEFLTDLLLNTIGPMQRRKAMQVVEQARMDNVLVGQRLVGSGLISASQLDSAVHEHAQSAFTTILEITDGHFFLESGEAPDFLKDVQRIPLMQVLMNGLRILDERMRAQQVFENEDDVMVRMISNHENVDLTEAELDLFGIIDGNKTLKEIIECSHVSAMETKRVCHRLVLIGLVKKRQLEPVAC